MGAMVPAYFSMTALILTLTLLTARPLVKCGSADFGTGSGENYGLRLRLGFV